MAERSLELDTPYGRLHVYAVNVSSTMMMQGMRGAILPDAKGITTVDAFWDVIEAHWLEGRFISNIQISEALGDALFESLTMNFTNPSGTSTTFGAHPNPRIYPREHRAWHRRFGRGG